MGSMCADQALQETVDEVRRTGVVTDEGLCLLSPRGRQAVRLAQRGYRVFLLGTRSKEPMVGFKRHHPTSDVERVVAYWAEHPQSNVGLWAGEELLIVDIDGKAGEASFKRLLAELKVRLPPIVPAAVTGGGGRHLFFRSAHDAQFRPSSGAFGDRYPGIDVRAGNSYVVAPSSSHPAGGSYEWCEGRSLEEHEPPEAPQALLDAIQRGRPLEAGNRRSAHLVTAGEPSIDGVRRAAECDGTRVGNEEVFRSMLKYIDGADDRSRWIQVGMACHDQFDGSDLGLMLWNEWSRQSCKYQDGDCEAKWTGFTIGRGTTQGSLIYLAREGGWSGSEELLYAVDPPALPRPTWSPVEPESDFRAVARDGVVRHFSSEYSTAFSGPPGLAKTTAMLWQQVRQLHAGATTTAISAHLTRSRALEVYGDPEFGMRCREAGVRLVLLLGRGSVEGEPFYCAATVDPAHAARKQSRRHSCRMDADHRAICEATPGHYLYDCAQARDALREDGPVLILTTIDKLEWLEEDLGESGREDFQLAMDDPGPSFGLFKEVWFPTWQFQKYSDGVARWLQSAAGSPEDRLLAELLRSVVEKLLMAGCDLRFGDWVSLVRGLGACEKEAVERWRTDGGAQLAFERKGASPFDDTAPAEMLPACGSELLGLVGQVLDGLTPSVRRSTHEGDHIAFARPNEFVLRAVKEGRVCFLSVALMPEFVSESLGIDRLVATWMLRNDVVGVTAFDDRSSWHGEPFRVKKANVADKVVAGLLKRVSEACEGVKGFLGTKSDSGRLADINPDRLLVGHYGMHHAGTNKFEHVSRWWLRRWRPHPEEVKWTTAGLLGCLGKSVPELGAVHLEVRWMPGDRGPQPSALRVPVNPLEREVYRAFEGQHMLNALGRCRPLANPACPIYVLDSAPIEGVEFTRTCRLQDLDLGFDLQAVVDEARMHDRTSARRKAVQEVLDRMPGAGKDEVQEVLERDYPGLDFTSRQVQELICEGYRRSGQVKSTEDPIEKNRGNPRGFILVSRLLSAWTSDIERAVADLISESQEWVHRQMLKMKRTGQFPEATYVSASRRLDRLWSAFVEVARRGAVPDATTARWGPEARRDDRRRFARRGGLPRRQPE